ncbi:hypothetical protein Tco_1547207 [Tanacetum coccineum]
MENSHVHIENSTEQMENSLDHMDNSHVHLENSHDLFGDPFGLEKLILELEKNAPMPQALELGLDHLSSRKYAMKYENRILEGK